MKLHELLGDDAPSLMIIRRKDWTERIAVLVCGYNMFMCEPDLCCQLNEFRPITCDIIADDWEIIPNIPAWRPPAGEPEPQCEERIA